MSLLLNQAHANTNESKILKLFVGDLVNKGPKSRDVLKYLVQRSDSNCFSVRGNHDEIVYKEWLKWKDNSELATEENKWITNLTNEEIDYIKKMPYSISVPSLNLIVVHAGMIPGLTVQEMKPLDLLTMRNLIKDEKGGWLATKNDKEGV